MQNLQMWSMDYVQVPAEEEKPEEIVTVKEKNEGQNSEENQTETTKKRVHELVKQMSISAEGSGKCNIIVFNFFLLSPHILMDIIIAKYCLYCKVYL